MAPCRAMLGSFGRRAASPSPAWEVNGTKSVVTNVKTTTARPYRWRNRGHEGDGHRRHGGHGQQDDHHVEQQDVGGQSEQGLWHAGSGG